MTWVAVGTAAAVGAGVGAGSQLIQGKGADEALKAALIGGTVGAVTGGAGSALGGASGGASSLTTEAASQLAPELIQTAATNVAPEVLSSAATNVAPAGIEQITPEMINAVNQGSADAIAAQGTGVQSAGINNIGYTPSAAQPTSTGIGLNAGPNPSVPGPFDTGVKPMIQGNFEPGTAGQLQPNFINSSTQVQYPGSALSSAPVTPPPASNSFMQGFSDFATKHPFMTGAGIYGVASVTGMLDQDGQQQPTDSSGVYTGPRLSADFKGGPYSKPNVYEEKRYNYAAGGIAQAYQAGGPVERMTQANTAMNPQGGLYPQGMIDKTQYATPTQRPTSLEVVESEPNYEARTNPMTGTLMAGGGIASVPRYYRGRLATSDSAGGRDVYGTTQRFLDMYDPSSRYAAPADAGRPDVGIFSDSNPNTKNKSVLEATEIRQDALEKRANVNTKAKYVPPSRGMGQLSFAAPGVKGDKEKDYDSVAAAGGGIMQANLGGYAAGGNPRLLRGPGDGMSDDIPATIGGRQPARLADGEFVVPADVVSHLGNGSTEAGAKKLHQMMDKVRVDRTGKKKQAPAVKAGKYIPK
jgi:hypothetical protein